MDARQGLSCFLLQSGQVLPSKRSQEFDSAFKREVNRFTDGDKKRQPFCHSKAFKVRLCIDFDHPAFKRAAPRDRHGMILQPLRL